MTAPVREAAALRRSLSVWQAVGLSVAVGLGSLDRTEPERLGG